MMAVGGDVWFDHVSLDSPEIAADTVQFLQATTAIPLRQYYRHRPRRPQE